MRLLSSIAILAISATSANAAIFTYDFPGTPRGSGSVAAQTAAPSTGATFIDFSRTNVNANDGTNIFNSTAWNTTSTLDASEYVSFSLTIAAGYSATVTDLTFAADGSNTVADEFEVRYSTDGFSSFVARGSDTVTTSPSNETWNFSDISLTAGQTLSFRFYVFGDTQADGGGVPSSAGTFSLDNVTINGTVIPEPASLGLIGLASLVGLRRRRR